MKGGAGNECSKHGDTCYTSEFKTQFLNIVGESDVIFFEYYQDGEDTIGKKFIILKPKKEVESYFTSPYIVPQEGTVALYADSINDSLKAYVPLQEFYFDRIKQHSIKPVPKKISDAREANLATKLGAQGQTITKYITETLSEQASDKIASFGEGLGNITMLNSTTQETNESKGASEDVKKIKQLFKDQIPNFLKNVDLILSPENEVVDEDIKQMNNKLDLAMSYLFPFLEYQHIITDLGLAGPEDKTTKYPIAFLDKLSQIVNKHGDKVLPAIKKINGFDVENKNLFIKLGDMQTRLEKIRATIEVELKTRSPIPFDTNKSGMMVGIFQSGLMDSYYPVILSSDGKFLISDATKQGALSINKASTLCPNGFEKGYLLFTYNKSGCPLVGTRKSQSVSAQASRNLGSVGTSVKSRIGSLGSIGPMFSRSVTATAKPPAQGGNKRLTRKNRKQKKQKK